jgi:1-acyl-sn-glycerol-3-phosphate acyltransferase
MTWPISPRGNFYFYLARTAWAPGTLRIGSIRLKVEGAENIDPARPTVYVSTHSSMCDIPALMTAFPMPIRMMAKNSIKYVPLFGWLLSLSGFVFIKRGDSAEARKSITIAAKKLVSRGHSVLVFAEGTRTGADVLRPFKKGAFLLAIFGQVPIVPVAVIGTGRILPPHSLIASSGEVMVRIGQPISTAGMSYEDRNRLLESAQQAVIELSGWPLVKDDSQNQA